MEKLRISSGGFLVIILGAVFSAGLATARLLPRNADGATSPFARLVESGEHTITSPILDCEISENDRSKKGVIPFGSGLNSLVNQEIKSGNAAEIAVYYRDLNNGPWIGINEAVGFLPASLLKVPVMMAYLKEAENDPRILAKEVHFTEALDARIQSLPSGKQLELGKTYTIEQLIEHSIKYSNNQAYFLLLQNIAPSRIYDVYARIGVNQSVLRDPEATLSVKSYASFFRILYNATYLSREMSEKALGILADAESKEGIRAGTPENVPVAHKFGESGTTAEKQFHQCGIVYHPVRPYLLCIMTKGNSDIEKLLDSVKKISSFIHQEVEKNTR